MLIPVEDIVCPSHFRDIKITSISIGAFENCKTLKTIRLPRYTESIHGEAFKGCRSLTSVTIPDSVTSIGNWAFENCSGLTSVIMPKEVTRIWGGTFYGCDSSMKLIYCGKEYTLGKMYKEPLP